MVGLAGGLVVFVVLGMTRVVGVDRGDVVLVFVQFLALLAAGYVGGRFASSDRVAHGSFAALLLFVMSMAITVAVSSDRPGAAGVVVLGVVAAVLGSAGGALAELQRR